MAHLDFIENVLKETTDIARRSFGKVEGRTKPDDNNQVLTDADLEIGQFIIKKINDEYPNHNVIDEETGVIDKRSKFTWVIDPIDGTSNFAAGVPTYGTIIGLLENDIPIAGGIALPAFSEIILAEKGKGAFLNSKKILVTEESDLSKMLVAVGVDSHPDDPAQTNKEMEIASKILLQSRNLRTSNSVFDVVMVSKGAYGGWVCFTSKIWDNVGAQIVLEEAGGVYTNINGEGMDYSNPLSKAGIIFSGFAASGVLHKKIQKIIHSD